MSDVLGLLFSMSAKQGRGDRRDAQYDIGRGVVAEEVSLPMRCNRQYTKVESATDNPSFQRLGYCTWTFAPGHQKTDGRIYTPRINIAR